jgi:acetylornithine deacetylase/succinyl-diaminopimelate desuccinylase-like protein
MKRALLYLVFAATALPAKTPAPEVRTWRQAHERQLLEDFSKFVAMPNVATTLADVGRNAAYLSQQLETRGFVTRLLRASEGTPATVYGERSTPGATRTVLFYAHYDGQPIGQKGWTSKPFEPVVRAGDRAVDWRSGSGPIDPDWRIYGRGTGDDKASVQAMLSALDALKARGIKPSVNIKIIWEGEEEQGSPHLAEIVRANRDLLKADLLIMGDGPMHQSGKQMINFGNRGITGFRMTVHGPNRPLHDGHYGSWVPSPSVMMARLIASMRDDDGKILIPGIYDDVAPITAADREALAALPPIEGDLRRQFAIGRTLTERLADGYLRPTFNVRAIHVGDEGPDAANAIATEATASFDIRLVPNQKPARVQEQVDRYLTGQGWFVVHDAPDAAARLAHPKVVRVDWDEGSSEAIKTPLDSPAGRSIAQSIGRTVGYPVLKLPISGGSSGIADVANALSVPMIGVSIANFDDNQHAQNENLRIGNLWDGIEVYAGLLADLNW